MAAISTVANVFKKNLNTAAGFGKKLFGIPTKVQEARKFSAAPTFKEARGEPEETVKSSGGMSGVLDELRALKNSGIVSKTRPPPPGGDDPVTVIDIPKEEVFDEPTGESGSGDEEEKKEEEEPGSGEETQPEDQA